LGLDKIRPRLVLIVMFFTSVKISELNIYTLSAQFVHVDDKGLW